MLAEHSSCFNVFTAYYLNDSLKSCCQKRKWKKSRSIFAKNNIVRPKGTLMTLSTNASCFLLLNYFFSVISYWMNNKTKNMDIDYDFWLIFFNLFCSISISYPFSHSLSCSLKAFSYLDLLLFLQTSVNFLGIYRSLDLVSPLPFNITYSFLEQNICEKI